jgi:hypothetical protein
LANSKIAELQKENNDLRQLVIQLSKIIIRNVVDQRGVLDIRSEEAAPRLLVAMRPDEISPLLRELSLHCAHASRECRDDRTAQELEGLSVELADTAQKLEAQLLARRSDE